MSNIERVTHLGPLSIVISVQNSKKNGTYDINVMFLLNEDKWEPMWCSCKGFDNWMRCKHIESVREYISHLPKPTTAGPMLKLNGYWYECDICMNKSFMFCPPLNKRGVTQAVCTKCGRAYEVI